MEWISIQDQVVVVHMGGKSIENVSLKSKMISIDILSKLTQIKSSEMSIFLNVQKYLEVKKKKSKCFKLNYKSGL